MFPASISSHHYWVRDKKRTFYNNEVEMTRTTHHKPGSRSATSLDSVEVEVTRRTLSKAETWKHGQYIRHKIPSPWLLEAGSLVLSISSMVAILIILTRNNGIAVNEWTLSISINTLVSVLGVISRASLGLTVAACLGQQKWNWFRDHRDEIQVFDKFDRASQGAAGSLLAVKCFLNASRIRQVPPHWLVCLHQSHIGYNQLHTLTYLFVSLGVVPF